MTLSYEQALRSGTVQNETEFELLQDSLRGVQSDTIRSAVALTQADYNGLVAGVGPDAETLYLIVG